MGAEADGSDLPVLSGDDGVSVYDICHVHKRISTNIQRIVTWPRSSTIFLPAYQRQCPLGLRGPHVQYRSCSKHKAVQGDRAICGPSSRILLRLSRPHPAGAPRLRFHAFAAEKTILAFLPQFPALSHNLQRTPAAILFAPFLLALYRWRSLPQADAIIPIVPS